MMDPLLYLWCRLTAPRDDRGDVPGWVMITVMSAILVVAILAVAQDQLVAMVNKALGSVSGKN